MNVSRRGRRPAFAACAAAMIAVPLLSACGAGQISVTRSETSVIDGTNGALHQILVRYAYIDNETGYDVIPVGGDARAYLRIFNNGDQDETFLGASTDAARSVTIVPESAGASTAPATPSSGGATVTSLPVPSAGELAIVPGHYHLQISGLRETLRSAQTIPITFRFAHAGELTLQVPVQVPPSPPPVGSVSPTPETKPGNVEPAPPGRRVSPVPVQG